MEGTPSAVLSKKVLTSLSLAVDRNSWTPLWFGESAFGVHWRDPKAFCHSGNGSLIVKHAQCRKEHLFSSRQVLWIFLGCAHK